MSDTVSIKFALNCVLVAAQVCYMAYIFYIMFYGKSGLLKTVFNVATITRAGLPRVHRFSMRKILKV